MKPFGSLSIECHSLHSIWSRVNQVVEAVSVNIQQTERSDVLRSKASAKTLMTMNHLVSAVAMLVDKQTRFVNE